jgi:hypothetical protein
MIVRTTSLSPDGRATGYRLHLSAKDTYAWARKPGAAWPCSTLSDHNVAVEVDSNGLCDIPMCPSGDVDSHELEAIISDYLPAEYRHLWPVWA